MSLSENLLAMTNKVLAPKVADTVLDSSPLVGFVLADAENWRGATAKKGVIVERQDNGTSFRSGTKVFSTNKEETKVTMEFEAKGREIPVVIDGIERDLNDSDPQRSADLVKEAMEEAQNSMITDIAEIFYSDGTGNGGDDFLGLGAIVDNGVDVATIGGLSRATYTTLKAHVEEVTGALTSLEPLRAAHSAAGKGNDQINLNITSKTKWDEFEALLQAVIQFNVDQNGYAKLTRNKIVKSKDGLAAEAGFNALYFRGAPVVADEYCPDLKWFGLNTKHLKFRGLKSSKYKPVTFGANTQIEGSHSGSGVPVIKGFSFSGLMDPINQYSEIGHFLLEGELISFNPNRHMRIDFTV